MQVKFTLAHLKFKGDSQLSNKDEDKICQIESLRPPTTLNLDRTSSHHQDREMVETPYNLSQMNDITNKVTTHVISPITVPQQPISYEDQTVSPSNKGVINDFSVLNSKENLALSRDLRELKPYSPVEYEMSHVLRSKQVKIKVHELLTPITFYRMPFLSKN